MQKENLTPQQSLETLQAVQTLKDYGIPELLRKLRQMKESYARDHINSDNSVNVDVSLSYEHLCHFLEQLEKIEDPEKV